MFKENILECIGDTPLVKINNITSKENLKCRILVKCEYLNFCVSIKE